MDALRYPIGQFQKPEDINSTIISEWIDIIDSFPSSIESLTATLSNKEKGQTYRPNGWNIAQIVHHCADSHMNAYIRFKWALTEEQPRIKAYFEDRWAEIPEAKDTDISYSLDLLKALHRRWVLVLKNLSEQDLQRSFIHPETEKVISLDVNIGMYAWHCEHHLAHIKLALSC